MITEKPLIAFGILVVLLVGLVAGLVWEQHLERDEGYMCNGAWMVARDQLPYRDFVFPQQPYFPLMYSPVMRMFGPSLVAARAASALLFVGLVVGVYLCIARYIFDCATAIWPSCLFAFNSMTLFWYTRAKQYVLTDALLFLGFLLLLEARRRRDRTGGGQRVLLIAAGLASGAAMHVRLLVLPAIAVFVVAAANSARDRRWYISASWFAMGVAIASLPFLWIMAQAPSAWFFQTVQFQSMVRPWFGVEQFVSREAWALKEFFKLPVIALLGVLAATSIWFRFWVSYTHPNAIGAFALRFSTAVFGVLLGSALLCHPTQRQYMVQTLPYLAVTASFSLAMVVSALRSRRVSRLGEFVVFASLIFLGAHRAVNRVLDDRHNDPKHGLGAFLAYQAFMTEATAQERAMIMTWWPGYLLVPGVEPYPGAELGRPGDRVAPRLSPAEYRARGLRHPADQRKDLEDGRVTWVVRGLDAPEDLDSVLQGCYTLAAGFGDARVYRRSATCDNLPQLGNEELDDQSH